MVGTFDLGNFGDLLFPILAKHELETRLGQVEIVPFSFREMGAEGWPYQVHAVGGLTAQLPSFDALLVGGGHLVRFDGALAPGYGPTDLHTSATTGLWLDPTLAAVASGVPVMWSALGVHGLIPEWASQLVGDLLADVTYIAVRDAYSAESLGAVHAEVDVHLVPDTGFGAAQLAPAQPTRRWSELRSRLGVRGDYVVLQPSPQLVDHRATVDLLLDTATREGLQILEMPISPVLGDRVGVIQTGIDTIPVEPWPDPQLLIEIVAGSQGAIAQSLHLSIVASACGVPVHRPPSVAADKYSVLDGLTSVRVWSEAPDLVFGRRAPSQDVKELVGQVEGHWDRVAGVIRAERDTGRRDVPRFVGAVPPALERAARLEGELRVLRNEYEELAAEHRRVREHRAQVERELEAWEGRRAVRTARRFKRALGR